MSSLPRYLSYNKHDISKFRFRELYYFSLQYREWIEELADCQNTMKSKALSLCPISNKQISDTVQSAAIHSAMLSEKIRKVEEAAEKSDKELAKYIIMGVTENLSFTTLEMQYNIPCSQNTYYDRKRKYYIYLDKIL